MFICFRWLVSRVKCAERVAVYTGVIITLLLCGNYDITRVDAVMLDTTSHVLSTSATEPSHNAGI